MLINILETIFAITKGIMGSCWCVKNYDFLLMGIPVPATNAYI